jgi:nucleotide-binding universal stress UspA family protein
VADEEDSDLIIMGSRGLKRLESILQNSVSQYVFQLTARPMLLVKDDIYVKQIRRIMVAMNKSEDAQRSLNLALSFLREIKGGQLFLVHVNPDRRQASEATTNAENDPVLAPAVAEAKKQGVSYRCINTSGKAGEEMCRLAEEMNIDLLILGSPDRRPSIAKSLPDLDRLLGASLSDYIRVYANCPVLLARVAG